MQPKCGIFQERLEKLKSNFAYAKRLISDFERTGKEEEDSIEFWVQNIETEVSFFKERMTTSHEREAEEILGKEYFVGTQIAQNIFGATLDVHDTTVPFSLAELMQAKLEGKVLLYRPDFSTSKITPEELFTQVSLNNPKVNMEFFTDEHAFDFSFALNALRNHPLRNDAIRWSSWNLIKFYPQELRYGEAVNEQVLPRVEEALYDILASKKVAKFLRDQNTGMLWTSSNGELPSEKYVILGAKPGNELRLQALMRPKDDELPFYACESRNTVF